LDVVIILDVLYSSYEMFSCFVGGKQSLELIFIL